jgi:Zn-dependent peptidase ImmA (M78 family)
MAMNEIKECNWGKALIKQIADRVREVANFDPIEEENFSNVVKAFGGKIIEESENLSSEDSIKVIGQHDFSITLDVSATPERKRFTMAHELGHYFLHSKQGQIPLKAFRLGTSLAEQEANFFAANLLMPEDEFKRRWNSYKTSTDAFRIAGLASLFHVSVAAAAARAEYLFGKK